MRVKRMRALPVLAVYLCHREIACWQMSATQAGVLSARFPGYRVCLCADQAELLRALPEAEIVLTWTFRQEWLALAPALRVLSTPAAGLDYFSVELPPRIRRLNGQFHGELMAETAVAMLLGISRGLLPAASEFGGEAWPRAALGGRIRPLRGSRVTILGCGHIGGWIGRLLKPFGVQISGMRRHLEGSRPEWMGAGDQLFTVEHLDEVLARTDHLVAVLPGDTGADRLLDAARLRLLPAHATLCNLGRGNLLDYDALVAVLRGGHLSGVCLDVFAEEPLPADSRLIGCPRLWRLPHLSAAAPNYLDLYIDDFIRQLSAL